MQATILIADDDAATREYLQRTLDDAGFETETATDGHEAQERLSQGEFDVVVIDLVMPELDGFELLKWVRTHKPGVTPVMLSETSNVEDALKAVREGAFDFVVKRMGVPDEFLQHIQRAVAHKQLQDSHDRLVHELREKNVELENRLGQLELAHSILQAQAVAVQVDLNRATRIQQGLLPRDLPFAESISVSTAYEPAGKVGGDLYDLFKLDDHHLGLYVADASGHGISSAMLTVFLKHGVEEALQLVGNARTNEPGEVLNTLNNTILSEEFGQGVFVSMTYLVLDVNTLEARFSSAGHRPMFLRRVDGTVERLRQPGPVLGVNSEVKYTPAEFSLGSGDVLVLLTDGITDARNTDGDFYGEERLKKAIVAADNRAEAIVQSIQQDVASFSEGRPNADDATLLVLAAEPQRVPFHVPKEEATLEPAAGKQTEAKVLTAQRDGRMFISVCGAGSWRESQEVLDLCKQAREAGESSVIMDFSNCTHLDSTFMGVLHNIVTGFDESPGCRFEIQNLPQRLLSEISELGLTRVLMDFRHEPVELPQSMVPVEGGVPSGEESGRLLLWAHEALVEADPSNADRFGTVLKVLHDRVKGKRHDAPAQTDTEN